MNRTIEWLESVARSDVLNSGKNVSQKTRKDTEHILRDLEQPQRETKLLKMLKGSKPGKRKGEPHHPQRHNMTEEEIQNRRQASSELHSQSCGHLTRGSSHSWSVWSLSDLAFANLPGARRAPACRSHKHRRCVWFELFGVIAGRCIKSVIPGSRWFRNFSSAGANFWVIS